MSYLISQLFCTTNEAKFKRSSLFGRLSSCSTHLSIFSPYQSERCWTIVVWSTSILVANSLVETAGFVSTNAFRVSFFTEFVGLPHGLFCREKSSDRIFLNQGSTLRWFTLQTPGLYREHKSGYAKNESITNRGRQTFSNPIKLIVCIKSKLNSTEEDKK